MKLKIEEDFLDWATNLVKDDKWWDYRERWVSQKDKVKRKELLYVFRVFCKEYCTLLCRAVMKYVDLYLRTVSSTTSPKNIRSTEIIDAAFEFVEQFTTREYQGPWSGHFVLPRRPTDSRPQGSMPDEDAWIDLQEVKTAWFDKVGTVEREELLEKLSYEVQSGEWRPQGSARALNEVQLHLRLKSIERRRPPIQRQDPIRARVAVVKRDHPEITQIGRICQFLDAAKVLLPVRWRKLGGPQTWHGMWSRREYRARVKTYVSNTKPAAPAKE